VNNLPARNLQPLLFDNRNTATMTIDRLRDMILSNDEDGIRKLLPSISPEAATLVNSPVSLPIRIMHPNIQQQ
jgi:hypothetical protein